jgi:AAA domain-containing protein
VTPFDITIVAKDGGPLTKRISLSTDGSLMSDGSACVMSTGSAKRFVFEFAWELAELIGSLGPHEAIAAGRLREDLPSVPVRVTTKRKLNGATRPVTIARTRDYIDYRPAEPAFALLDFDQKGMPPAVAARIEEVVGLWAALISVIPDLDAAARVVRPSTSAGLYRADTGEQLAGSGGLHIYLAVCDGADIDRFLKTLHQRCWLAGLGWMMLGAGGQLLERSVVDRVVGTPERLIFEGAPVLIPPVTQDPARRWPDCVEGDLLNTVTACPALSPPEQRRYNDLLAAARAALAPDANKARSAFIARQAERLIARGVAPDVAVRTVERQCEGILLPDLVLPFDDGDLAGATVADVLADPARFEGETLADPLEGIEYGTGKAKIMRRADGSLLIHSFAHGRTVYELRRDDAKPPGVNVADLCLTLRQWIEREIPPDDNLMGEWLSTTSRVMLVATTGLGKTNFALALGLAMSLGRDFLHWRAQRRARVLYIDGEMSKSLFKRRIDDALRRADAPVDTPFFGFCRDDFHEMPPLDTEAGQSFIDALIEKIGGVDFIILDNVQALLSGNMKEEEPWEATLPWVRRLTGRRIGQLWIHHTGHDETRSYGTKTREWQLDTVAVAEAVERPEADIAFQLKFTKARQRTPDNRADFEPAIVVLSGDAWTSERGNLARSGKPQARDRALTLLIDAVARHGTIPPASQYIPPATLCVPVGLWRRFCALGCISEGGERAADKAFERAAKKLLEQGRVGKHDLFVWPVG